jgi:hypothetical protein
LVRDRSARDNGKLMLGRRCAMDTCTNWASKCESSITRGKHATTSFPKLVMVIAIPTNASHPVAPNRKRAGGERAARSDRVMRHSALRYRHTLPRPSSPARRALLPSSEGSPSRPPPLHAQDPVTPLIQSRAPRQHSPHLHSLHRIHRRRSANPSSPGLPSRNSGSAPSRRSPSNAPPPHLKWRPWPAITHAPTQSRSQPHPTPSGPCSDPPSHHIAAKHAPPTHTYRHPNAHLGFPCWMTSTRFSHSFSMLSPARIYSLPLPNPNSLHSLHSFWRFPCSIRDTPSSVFPTFRSTSLTIYETILTVATSTPGTRPVLHMC